MFKTAARKIAHNTTMPGLPGLGKQDLRALQELITAEKAILHSLQKLSQDVARASEALKNWAIGEGEDLTDTLGASTTLLLYFSSALATFANHESMVREHMKSVRSREESLDELKRRRRSVFNDAEAAERKLSKMNPENKNLQQQTDLLNRLRDEIRTMDTDIMTEEARLGDYKRACARNWMGLKFGGLLECCEKGAIIGELGKLVIAEIPLEPAQPGLPRPYYTGHARTEFLIAEAARSIGEVYYSPDPNPTQRTIRGLPGPELPPVPSPSQRQSTISSTGQPSYGLGSPGQTYPGLPQVEESTFNIQQFMSPEQPHTPLGQVPPVSEFGTFPGGAPPQTHSMNAMERDKSASPRGGRFATFPVKTGGPRPIPGAGGSSMSVTNPYIAQPLGGGNGDRVPSLEIDRNAHDSFSSSVALALDQQFGDSGASSNAPSAPGPSSGSNAPAPQGPPTRDTKDSDFAPQRYSPPPPMYTPADGNRLPVGAAPPNPPNSMHTGLEIQTNNQAPGSRPHSTLDDNEDGLAYMSPSHGNDSHESLHDGGDRRVRFGEVSDVDRELDRRHAEREAAVLAAAQREQSPPANQNEQNMPHGRTSPEASRYSQLSSPPTAAHSATESNRAQSPPSLSQPRIPTPPPAEDASDEHSLNAAAAREVSRELDALMMSSPPVSPLDKAPASPWGARPQPPNQSYQRPSISPRPSLEPATSGNASQASSPKLEGMYVRERDRSLGSPIVRAPPPDILPTPASPSGSNEGSDHMQRSGASLPPRMSPAPTIGSTGTPYRTPLETPLAPPPTGSLYNLPGTTGSNTSFSGSAAGGVRTISAAAFRRPPRNPSVPPPEGRSSPAPADVTPLNVKKRPLPSSPYPSPYPSANLQAPGGVVRPGSSGGTADEGGQRPLTHYRQDDDDFDYISAYTDGPGGGGDGNAAHGAPTGGGYHQGRFATNLEDNNNGVL
ncbi:hypothetical protein BD413DRAFT_468189 [Trametes elegans]|nr:hypothetical protein BD413DRAFT_468189 [Trametes elegans]